MTLWERIEELERRVGELEAIRNQTHDPEHARMMQVGSLLPPPDPYKELSRASGLLLRALDELDSDIHTEPITLQLREDIASFLARARVAAEKP